MSRCKLTIEYDGTPFAGWQRQANGRAVQEAIEDALFAYCGQRVTIRGAGRTDSGVHATGQVAHVDLCGEHRSDTVRDALNAHLRPEPVVVLSAEVVPDSFDARTSATSRRYRYKIADRRPPLALEKNRMWHVRGMLDHGAMHKAAQRLLGRHDFTTFRDAACQANSPLRTLDRLDVHRSAGGAIEIVAQARSFLHRQVRSMVGSLKLVGEGRWSADDLFAALKAADRAACGAVAPAHGLYLEAVAYPERPVSDDDAGVEK